MFSRKSDLSLPCHFVVIAVCLLFIFLIGTASGMPMREFGIIAAGFAVLTLFTAVSVDRRLQARITQRQPWLWQIAVNDVPVGTIADGQYAAILRGVLRNWRVAAEQIQSSLNWATVFAGKVVLISPLVLFWLLALLSIAFPDESMPMVQELFADWQARAWNSATLQNTIGITGMLSFFLAILSMPARSLSRYELAADRLLRRHLNTPADGDVQVFRLPAHTDHANPA
ncbi:hypothetical protein A7J71_09900 [Achromobacter insolitus]|uniref:hypothetical protein n=1 Tax=Achromobacter insolitus TaxID=217204 RepID=UPI0007C66000|nr:hypothetical protein [Achromobacter insolitus]OAE61626.1 hypothetical protein A7J71_09900 [Achromobacter insolitus]OCZ61868.1 hypothetical protein A7P22_24065 [Achromobacter insolitus]